MFESLTQREIVFFFHLDIISIQNVVQRLQVFERFLRGGRKNKTAIKEGEVPAFFTSHSLATR